MPSSPAPYWHCHLVTDHAWRSIQVCAHLNYIRGDPEAVRGCDILLIATRREQIFTGGARGESRKQHQEHMHALVRRAFKFRHANCKGKTNEYLFTILVKSAARLLARPYLLVRYVNIRFGGAQNLKRRSASSDHRRARRRLSVPPPPERAAFRARSSRC